VSAPDPYAYSPYGTPYTAAPPEPVPTAPRPRLLIAVPVLMVLAALPFLLFGALFVAAPVAGIAQEVLASPNMQAAGATEALVVSAVRVLGGVILGVALLYLVFGFLAFAGRNWARITTAVLSGCDPVQPGCERLVRGTSVSFARLRVWTPSRPSSSRAPAPPSPVG
jgi:hypothetical protein